MLTARYDGLARVKYAHQHAVARTPQELWAPAFTPRGFGAVGDGVADDGPALQLAMAAAASEGKALDLGGHTYRVATPIAHEGSIHLRGPGTIFCFGDLGQAAIDLRGTWTAHEVIGPPEDLHYGLSSEWTTPGSLETSITRLPLTSISLAQIPVPSKIKVFSDDHSEGVEPNKNAGEFAYAVAKDSEYLYLSGPLQERDSDGDIVYATNIWLAVFDEHSVTVDNVDFRSDFDSGVAGNWNYALLRVAGHIAPRLSRCSFSDGNGRGLEFQSCLGHTASDIVVDRMRQAIVAGPQIPGYGIQDGCGQSGGYDRLFISHCRHAFTTVHYTSVFGDPLTHGRSRGHLIHNARGFANSSATWDTHDDAHGVTFLNCNSYQPFMGEIAAGAGFQLRGIANRAIGCSAIGGASGFVSMQGWPHAEANRHIFDGCFAKDQSLAAFDIRPTSLNPDGRASAVVRNSEFHNRQSIHVIRALQADLELKDVRCIHTGQLTGELERPHCINVSESGGGGLIPGGGVKLRADGLVYECENAGTEPTIVRFFGDDNDFEIEARVKNGANPWRVVLMHPGDGPYSDILARFDVSADTAPIVSRGYDSVGSGSDVRGRVRVLGGTAGDSGRISNTLDLGTGTHTIDVSDRTSPVVVLLVNGTGGTPQITQIAAGAIHNQMLLIVNAPGASASVAIINGGRISTSATRNIPASGSAMLVYDGPSDRWRLIGW